MTVTELKDWIDQHEDWHWRDDPVGLIVISPRFGTANLITHDAIARYDVKKIVGTCKRGRDVDHMTRVTGYFSRTSHWNKGKQGELKDRARVTVGSSDHSRTTPPTSSDRNCEG